MSWQWRRSKSFLGGLLRLTFGKRGVGVSLGTRRFRLSRSAGGAIRRTISLPGGFRNTKRLK